jgi:hypothetical protein
VESFTVAVDWSSSASAVDVVSGPATFDAPTAGVTERGAEAVTKGVVT